MSDDIEAFMKRARRALEIGREMQARGWPDRAGREAYFAAFHAASAFVLAKAGKLPKSHLGLHTRFAELRKPFKELPDDLVVVLGRSYRYKQDADYGNEADISALQASIALDLADELIAVIGRLLAAPDPS